MNELEKVSKRQLIDMINSRACAPSALYPNGLIGQKVMYNQHAVKKGATDHHPFQIKFPQTKRTCSSWRQCRSPCGHRRQIHTGAARH